MRVLVAGATSVPGLPLLRELAARGHDVVGLTRQSSKTPQIEQAGAKPVVADVFDADQINAVVADIEPEVVVSLLTTLPKRGPMRLKDFEPARALWGRGAPNLVAAAQRAGVRRIVAESVIFAYGYPSAGPALMDESDPYPGPPPPGGEAMLKALRDMEQTVLTSGQHSDTEGIVLRYGAFYGPGVPHDELFTRLVKWWAMPAPTGNGVVSWVHIDDVAKATADAVDSGRGGQIYNIVDDRPQSFGDYLRELAVTLHRPKPLPIPRRLFGLVAPYGVIAFGDTWLPLSNAKAKAELGWTPVTRNPALRSRSGSAR
jgi:nucleoside-diphosphate-sugar epimerase